MGAEGEDLVYAWRVRRYESLRLAGVMYDRMETLTSDRITIHISSIGRRDVLGCVNVLCDYVAPQHLCYLSRPEVQGHVSELHHRNSPAPHRQARDVSL